MSRSRPSRRPCVIHFHQLTNGNRGRAQSSGIDRDYEADLSVDGDSGRVVQAPSDAAALAHARSQKRGDELVFEVRLMERGKYAKTVYDIYSTAL